MGWTVSDMPPQGGRTAVVTGTGGLGYEVALALARAGADVTVAGRNPKKGAEAVARIQAAAPGAKVAFEPLDLASLASVEAFARRWAEGARPLHMLINNAGLMGNPNYEKTADGLELQFATNYLGHFALTARLLPWLKAAQGRVVNVSSFAYKNGKIDFDDLQAEKRYLPFKAYGQSKLAQILTTREFQRRSEAAGWGVSSYSAHPGYAATELFQNGPGGAIDGINKLVIHLFGHSAASGALPTLLAATAPDAVPGALYGPGGLFEMKGPPHRSKILPHGLDANAAVRLWEVSEALAGVKYG